LHRVAIAVVTPTIAGKNPFNVIIHQLFHRFGKVGDL
jgi:hypothetical protein